MTVAILASALLLRRDLGPGVAASLRPSFAPVHHHATVWPTARPAIPCAARDSRPLRP
ncbi:MAG: hypothetical protein R3B48_02680 [Kofleriaceae bacterium]